MLAIVATVYAEPTTNSASSDGNLNRPSLEITDDETSTGHYEYKLSYDDMSSERVPLQFEADVWQRQRFHTVNEDAGPRFISVEAGENEAFLIYRFDFSKTKWKPTEMFIRDVFILWDHEGKEGQTAVSAWSTDNITYHELHKASTANEAAEGGFSGGGGTKEVELPPNTTTVYYKFRVVVDGKDVDGVFTGPLNLVHWNRESADDEYFFHVQFNLSRK